MRPPYYDIKTAAQECKCSPREMLLFADEGRLSLGIRIKNREVLLLRNGQNPHIQHGEKALRRAYEGAKPISGILHLKHHHIAGILKREAVTTSMFAYRKDGYDEALLLLNNRPDPTQITMQDLFIEIDDLAALNPRFHPNPLSKKKRTPNDMKLLIEEKVTELALELGHKPEAKHLLKKLEEKNSDGAYAYPIMKVEGSTIYWCNGSNTHKKMSSRRVENILSEIAVRSR